MAASWSMALNPADVGLAEAVVAVSVTFWAIYMALYVFVFAHFQSSSVKERLTVGTEVYKFFVQGTVLAVFSFAAVSLAIVSLLIEQELPLAVAVSFFFSEFIIGTVLIVKQAGRVGRAALPYVATEYVVRELTRRRLEQFKAEKGSRLSRGQKKRLIRALLQDVGPDLLKDVEKLILKAETNLDEKPKWWKRKKPQAPVSGEKPKSEGQESQPRTK